MPAALQNLTWYLYLFCFLSTVLTPVFLIFPDSRKDSTDSVILKYLWQSTLTHKSPPGTKTDNKASHQSSDSLGVDVVNWYLWKVGVEMMGIWGLHASCFSPCLSLSLTHALGFLSLLDPSWSVAGFRALVTSNSTSMACIWLVAETALLKC